MTAERQGWWRRERRPVIGSTYTGPPRPFGVRLINAARLDSMTYEELEGDQNATPQAALVVVLAAASLALGTSSAGWSVVLSMVASDLLGWLLWSGITFLIGDKLLKGTASWGELQRTIGFAWSPGLLSGLRAIPVLDVPLQIIIALWKLLAVIIAIRQALDFSTGKAIATATLGFIAYVGLALVLSYLAGVPILGP
jgi:hypothetical protein